MLISIMSSLNTRTGWVHIVARCGAAVRERRQRRVGAAARVLGRVAVRPPAAAVDQGAAPAGTGQVRARAIGPTVA